MRLTIGMYVAELSNVACQAVPVLAARHMLQSGLKLLADGSWSDTPLGLTLGGASPFAPDLLWPEPPAPDFTVAAMKTVTGLSLDTSCYQLDAEGFRVPTLLVTQPNMRISCCTWHVQMCQASIRLSHHARILIRLPRHAQSICRLLGC